MKILTSPLLAALIAVSASAAWAQTTTNRVRQSTTAVRPVPAVTAPAIPVPESTPAVTPANPAGRRLNPGDTIRADDPIPQLKPRRQTANIDNNPFRLPISPALSAVYQPLGGTVEVFGVDAHGTLKNVWKRNDGFWEPSFNMSAPGLAPPGAPLAAIWYPKYEQLEVFTIATNGALTVTFKAHNGTWSQPSYITQPNFAEPGAQISAVVQPLNNQLEVFAVDPTGAVKVAWKGENGNWRNMTITPAGVAPHGAPLAAAWQPVNEQLEVFFVDVQGALRALVKQHNGQWALPAALTAPGFLTTRTKLAAIWQPLYDQLEVFAVDRAGAINVMWKAHNSRWYGPEVINGPGVARAGTDIMALWDEREKMLSVYTLGTRGTIIQAWKINSGKWKPGPGGYSNEATKPGTIGNWPLGAALAGVVIPRNNGFSGRELFTIDDKLAVSRVNVSTYGYGPQPNITTPNYGPIYGAHAAYCSNTFRAWSSGQGGLDTDENSPLATCAEYMGIAPYCRSKGAVVSVGYPPGSQRRMLLCTEPGKPENVVEQFVHISRGIGQGLELAFVTSLAYAPEIAQGYACLDGVVFACASLAVDLAARAIVLPPEIKDAIDIVNDASACADGDVISCAKLGAAGARAVGVAIPGQEAAEITDLTQKCLGEDYGACLRLGERAAMAAGLPLGEINQTAKEAQDCYAGDVDACIALGHRAADAGIPVGGLADGADNLAQCGFNRLDKCEALGKSVANTFR